MKKIIVFSLLFALACKREKDVTANEGFITAGGYNIFYQQQGQGPSVLFIHAGLQDHTMWNEQVKALHKNYSVTTIDLPYHGRSKGHDTTTLAKEVIKTILDSLKIDRTHIIGLSMGAAVTEDFLISYPQRVNKAVLMSAGINGLEKEFPIDSFSVQWYPKFLQALNAGDTAKAARIFTMTWSEGLDAKNDSIKKPASEYVYNTSLRTLQQHKLISWPHLENNPQAIYKVYEINMPVLIIHGDRDLPIITTSSKGLEKKIKNSRRVLLNGAAHMINLEKPAEVNKLLIDFFRQ